MKQFILEHSVYLGINFFLLLCLFSYMYKRIVILVDEQNKGIYAVNLLRSLIEIFIFLAVYFVAGIISTMPNTDLDIAAGGCLGAFLLSLAVINKKVYSKLGRFTILFASVVMTLFYTLVAYINTSVM